MHRLGLLLGPALFPILLAVVIVDADNFLPLFPPVAGIRLHGRIGLLGSGRRGRDVFMRDGVGDGDLVGNLVAGGHPDL
jgi:hypothetical protein